MSDELPENVEKWADENGLDKVFVGILYRSVNQPGFIQKIVEDMMGPAPEMKEKNDNDD